MNKDFERFLSLPEHERNEIFERTADRLGTAASHVEKDFWVCFVLDTLFNRLPKGHHRLLFKGGTSLSKAFDLVHRFSEDVDLVVYREELGFAEGRDPTAPGGISNSKRKVLFEELRQACGEYVRGDLADALTDLIGEHCKVVPDEKDPDQQTLLVDYPTLYPRDVDSYVLPQVKLEAGARSALDPNVTAAVEPYISGALGDNWSFAVPNINVIEASRTYLDKLMVLHGVHCGYRDDKTRMPREGNRMSRHYYDFAMITGTKTGKAALADEALLTSVREHSRIAFRQAWRKLDEAVPGTIRIVPQDELHEILRKDYDAMRRMMFGEPPDFDWILGQIRMAEDAVNAV